MKLSKWMLLPLLTVGCVSKADYEKEQQIRAGAERKCDSLVAVNEVLNARSDSLQEELVCLSHQIDSIRTDLIERKTETHIHKAPAPKLRPGVSGIGYKPIIYLYPADTIDVSVKLTFADSGKFTYTYPTYPDSGWNVTAFPDGKLIDRQGKSYYSLFWEGELAALPDDSTGFVVHRDSLNSFFERSLNSLGLNYKEKQEFIVYWSPKLMANEYSFIHFSRKNYANSVKMEISPAPTTINRFLMLYRKSSATEKVVPQRLENPGRTGFTVVEWGGAEMNDIQMRVQ